MPNELVEYVYKKHPYFQTLLGNGLRAFWDQVNPADPRLFGNPMTREHGWKDKFIPLAMHGDGVSFTQKGNPMAIVSMCFILATGW